MSSLAAIGAVVPWLLAGCGSSASDSTNPFDDAQVMIVESLDGAGGSGGDAQTGSDTSSATNEGGSDSGTADATREDAGSAHDAGSNVSDAAPRPLAAIPLATPDGFSYNAQAAIGGAEFALDVDTGSTTIAVASSVCSSCAVVSPLYTPSSSAVDTHMTAMSAFADGSTWAGEIFDDSFDLAHGTPVVSLDFVAIRQQSMFFEDDTYQGIMGMGPLALAETGTDSYVTKARLAGVSPILAFELCSASGTMWLGGYDGAAASAAPQYTPLVTINDSNPFYAVNVDDLSLGGTSLGYHTANFQEPIVDTGTSLLYLPTTIFNALVNRINQSSGFKSLFGSQTVTAARCVSGQGVTAAMVDAALPAMAMSLPSVTVGAPDFTLSAAPSQSYMFDDGNGTFCLAVGDGGTQDGSTLGDTFLRAFVTIVDLTQGQVGFAPDTGCTTAAGHRVVRAPVWNPHPRRHHR